MTSDKDRKKEAKWLSDLETLKAHHNKFQRDKEGYLLKDTKENAEKYMRVSVENSDRYVREENEKIKLEREKLGEEIKKVISEFYDKRDLAKKVLEVQPFYYDENKIWWYWDFNSTSWKITEETNILVIIGDISIANTINSKEKTEILEALRQEASRRKPKEMKKEWIQFKGEIFDIKTGEQFKATPEYFAVNPIPWELENNCFEKTPTMDKIFKEWVGEDYVKTLYEILAYSLIPDYPIHTLFYLIGGGLNGKTCYLNLLEKFRGKENITTSELDLLLTSRFEKTKLFKKSVCIIGECDFNELRKTSIMKKLTGQDLIGGEYKNKTPFDFRNYAKIIIATNNLPETTDKTIGFYRRQMLIYFPNRFVEKDGILDTIPEEEYKSLALKCCGILHELLKEGKFTNQGSVEERQKRYEDGSNPLGKFIKENCNTKNSNGFVWSWEFEERFNDWCRENKFRAFTPHHIGRKLKVLGFESDRKRPSDDLRTDNKDTIWRCWYGLEWKKKDVTDVTDVTL